MENVNSLCLQSKSLPVSLYPVTPSLFCNKTKDKDKSKFINSYENLTFIFSLLDVSAWIIAVLEI